MAEYLCEYLFSFEDYDEFELDMVMKHLDRRTLISSIGRVETSMH